MARGKARGREGHGPKRGSGGASGGDDSTRWMATYGDMVTLLMAFFVILFSFSQIDVSRFESFLAGLEQSFGNPAASRSILDGGAGVIGEAEGPEIQPEPADEQIAVSVEGLRDTADDIERALAEAGMAGVVQYDLDHRGLVLTIGTDAVLFATGSTELAPQGRHLLAQIAPILADVPNDIRVEGHTDDVPLSRNGYTNWNLSTDRAVAVLNLLHETHDVDPNRLVAVGYGEFRPIAPNENAEGRATNRRVEIIVAVPEKRSNVSQ